MDHIHNDSRYEPHSDEMFDLRYFFNDEYYQEGGPVIVLNGAEANAEGSLGFLQRGMIKMLAEATGGIGVVLEHRYYGKSFPVPDQSTENMRFLSSDQAMADMAYFSQNIVFPGHEDKDLTAPNTPYIYYGGSYAGGLVALYRKLYPDISWGAVSSASVTAPVTDFWEYYEITRKYAPADCVDVQSKLVNVIDNILAGGDPENEALLKSVFGLQDVKDNRNFVTVVTGGRGQWQSFVSLTAGGIGLWQTRQWDPRYYSGAFEQYCNNISTDATLYPETEHLTSQVEHLIDQSGWGCQSQYLTNKMLNLIGYVKRMAVSKCTDTQEQCFEQWTNSSATFYTDRSLSNQALGWPYQYCTQWGGIPSGDLPSKPGECPSLPLVSRLLNWDFNRLICEYAFNITTMPDTDHITKWGGHNLTYPRLAHVAGEVDNWRPLSPLAEVDGVPTALDTPSTPSEPKIIIKDGVHGWELFGVFENQTTADFPPQSIKDAQAEIIEAVQGWMEEWREQKGL